MEYVYDRLSRSQERIRIIKLLPAEFNESLVCEIENVLHDENLYYEALSYTWGDSIDRQQIEISGKLLYVTNNLWLALKYLRPKDKARYIWIDAICINQLDTHERNDQVRRMASVYQRAKKVHVWLGPSDKASLVAMSFLMKIDEEVVQSVDDNSCLNEIKKSIIDNFYQAKNASTWTSIVELWRRAYWTRIWIIQEVVFGTSKRFQCIVHCGYDSVSWETLEVFENAMSSIDKTLIDNEHSDVDLIQASKGARLDISWFLAIHGKHTRNKELPLSYLLVRQSHYKATDPRDKVYALLSMIHESQADGLKVDYDLSTAEIYIMAFKEMVLRERKLGILCACCRECRRRPATIALPSWCPDWSTDPMDMCCPARLWSYTKPVYFASGTLDADATIYSNDQSQPILSARGWHLDTISTRDVTFTAKGFPCPNSLRFLSRGICGQPSSSFESPDALSTEEAIWRTLVANRGISRDEPPSTFSHAFQALKEDTSTLPLAEVDSYRDKVQACLRKRMLCKSTVRLLPGIVPDTALDGDVICILVGCALPLILRQVQNHYVIIGESYIHGLMNGEIFDMENSGEIQRVTFEIH